MTAPDTAEFGTPIGWQEDGSYVPCPECRWKPEPEREGGPPGVAIHVMPRRPGSATHHGDCPTVALSRDARERLETRLAEFDECRRRAWEGAHNYVIG